MKSSVNVILRKKLYRSIKKLQKEKQGIKGNIEYVIIPQMQQNMIDQSNNLTNNIIKYIKHCELSLLGISVLFFFVVLAL